MFRVFGSPYTLVLHQHVAYLRLKQLPFKVYCTSLTTTLFYGLIYGARNAFCCLTPNGSSRLQFWQLAESAELDEDLVGSLRQHGQQGEVKYVATDGKPLTQAQRVLLNKRTHPQLHLASWATVLYACWWLAKTGAMYRWVLGEDLDVVEGYMRYFMFAAIPGLNFARTFAPKFREVMSGMTMITGVSRGTAPFMDEHFHRMCCALEAHFSQQPSDQLFLLGTPHPTLADVTLGAAFSSSFLTDEPPASLVAERYPRLVEYVERVTGWKGGTFVGDTATKPDPSAVDAASGAWPSSSEEKKEEEKKVTCDRSSDEFPDVVPESLNAFFAVMIEVFPFMMSQCASFNAYMSSDAVRTLKREPLEAQWKGCSGYLLPQMTNIKSLMIIDNTVCSVQARAQDLEIAFLAAQEVMDEVLQDFGRDALPVAEAHSSGGAVDREAAARAIVSSTTEADGGAAPSQQTENENVSSSEAEEREKKDGALTTTCAAADDSVGASEPSTTEGVLAERRPAGVIIDTPADIADADEADFYRVFTNNGIRQYGAVTLRRSSIVRSRETGGGLASRGVAGNSGSNGSVSTTSGATTTTVYERLAVLRGMLGKMRSPQYTLTSVFHGRRMYVAAIPEYEVAKVRAQRASAKANSEPQH